VIAPEPFVLPALSAEQATAVRLLAAAAPDAADNPPLSERALLHLHAASPVRHLVLQRDSELLGYAQLEPEQAGETILSAELVTAADQQDEVAAALLRALVDQAGDAPMRIWAHGSTSPVNKAAERAGLRVVRRLFQLRRPLAGLFAIPPLPDGVRIRPFVIGQDDAAWLSVNARAFAEHPEQGSWTQADLDARIASDWFDPAGFLLAERDGQLLGYHWTKVHGDALDEHGIPLGEVYVLGVDPLAQGMKLGSSLLLAGLAHLAERGLRTVLLYVDESNATAVRLYRGLGFETFATDVQYGTGG
jgi:mycothiol synthase